MRDRPRSLSTLLHAPPPRISPDFSQSYRGLTIYFDTVALGPANSRTACIALHKALGFILEWCPSALRFCIRARYRAARVFHVLSMGKYQLACLRDLA